MFAEVIETYLSDPQPNPQLDSHFLHSLRIGDVKMRGYYIRWCSLEDISGDPNILDHRRCSWDSV